MCNSCVLIYFADVGNLTVTHTKFEFGTSGIGPGATHIIIGKVTPICYLFTLR